MPDKSVAFTIRRARLLLGMTQSEFASLYGVGEATVYQWELGLARPKPEIWERLRRLTLKAYPLLDEELVSASPVYKYIADVKDLARPIVASRPIMKILAEVGASEAGETSFDIGAKLDRQSPHYDVSLLRALETIQANPEWLRGDIVYAEIHCFSAIIGCWVDGLVAPLPLDHIALIEGTPCKREAAEGFKVHLVRLQEVLSKASAEPPQG